MARKKYLRNAGRPWSPTNDRQLRRLARQNTPTGVIGFKLGRSPNAVRSRASDLKASLKPTNRSPYNRRRK